MSAVIENANIQRRDRSPGILNCFWHPICRVIAGVRASCRIVAEIRWRRDRVGCNVPKEVVEVTLAKLRVVNDGVVFRAVRECAVHRHATPF